MEKDLWRDPPGKAPPPRPSPAQAPGVGSFAGEKDLGETRLLRRGRSLQASPGETFPSTGPHPCIRYCKYGMPGGLRRGIFLVGGWLFESFGWARRGSVAPGRFVFARVVRRLRPGAGGQQRAGECRYFTWDFYHLLYGLYGLSGSGRHKAVARFLYAGQMACCGDMPLFFCPPSADNQVPPPPKKFPRRDSFARVRPQTIKVLPPSKKFPRRDLSARVRSQTIKAPPPPKEIPRRRPPGIPHLQYRMQ